MSTLLKTLSVVVNITRGVRIKRFKWHNEGIQYFGFKYYPSSPDFKDPPYEPTKLFRVERIKPLKGVPYYEKQILAQFHLDGLKRSDPVILKNIPEINQKLWKIKHLVRISPVTFPDGFPKDSRNTFLKHNGELKVMKVLDEKVKLGEEFRKDPLRIDGDTLRRNSRKRWEQAWE